MSEHDEPKPPAECPHEVILNGACLACGSTDLDPIAMSPKPAEVIAAERLVRRRRADS